MNTRPLLRLMSLILLIIVFASGFMMPRQAHAETDVSFSVFYDSLAPYGNWVNHRTYGQVWYPRDVPHGWRPYTDGHWAHTDEYGWMWVADQSWGWAPFHYGRWAWDDWYGWLWVPGYTWSPAWVFWRSGGGYAAWAPMPPNVLWQSSGLNISYFNYDRDLHWDSWVAVREYDLPYHHVRERCFSPRDNPRIIKVTNYINNVTVINKTIVNQGVPVRHIEHVTGRPVRRLSPVVRQEIQGHHQDHRRPLGKDTLEIIRPHRIEMSNFKQTHKDEELARRLDGKIPETSKIRLPVPVTPNLEQAGNKGPRAPKRLAIEPVLEPSSKPVAPIPALTGPLEAPSKTRPERPLLPALGVDADQNEQTAIGRNQKMNKPDQPVNRQAPGRKIEQRQHERDVSPAPVPLPVEPQQVIPRAVQAPHLSNELQSSEPAGFHPQEPFVDQLPDEKSPKQIKKQQAEQARQQAKLIQQQQTEQARQEARQMQQQQAEQARQESRQVQQQQAEQARQEARQVQQQQAEQARQEARQMQQQQAEQARQESRQMQQQQAEQARQEARQMQQQQAEQARQEARQMQQQQAEQARQEARQMQQQRAEQARQEARQVQQQRAEQARQQARQMQQQQAEQSRQEARQMQQQRVEQSRQVQQQAEQARQQAQQMQQQQAEQSRQSQQIPQQQRGVQGQSGRTGRNRRDP